MGILDWFRRASHHHQFGRWVVTERYELAVSNAPTVPIGTAIEQERQCETCGFIELDQQKRILQ